MIGSDGIRTALNAEGITDYVKMQTLDVFVMGIDRSIDYEKLVTACVAVQNGAN